MGNKITLPRWGNCIKKICCNDIEKETSEEIRSKLIAQMFDNYIIDTNKGYYDNLK